MENYYYTDGFAAFFDSRYTGWVHTFSPRLADHLDRQGLPERSVIDLCCGTGVTASVFCAAGWQATGVDGSAAMLDIARKKLAPAVESGTLTLIEADARTFRTPRPAAACVSLDGALNHLGSVAELTQCFTSVREALLPGGEFVFDLYAGSHFRHWNNVTLTDDAGAVIVKRGVWDDGARTGMLRVSGVFGTGMAAERVDQTLRSWEYDDAEVAEALEAAGLVPAEHDFEQRYVKCDSGSCSLTPVPCRTIYRARKPFEEK
ncbi:class I SAM-dependent methyltransferase [Streptomyces sp. NEAU-YJ-81]|uniref:class I SAM-dependent DNA methyltransferase n=1 Tax=Streptomyces sp. NEAU-YJ-81 TaxID=2820288 RepID=UPI001ABD1B24|nr:class I SAM-dependent methyltransferase [Streptomyces sp. NEAU-YJ-81]MBO3676422.1 class I SAM-dependent methyltransferase [Streptomyces sp. NEAU-YJ-81]